MKLLNLKRYITVILMIIAASLLAIYFQLQNKPINCPAAHNGYIDLYTWDFDKNGNVKLDGQWEFYWGRLLSPSDFQTVSSTTSVSFIKVPSPWDRADKYYKKFGAATYRLKIRIKDADAVYGLKTTNIRMSNKIFVNGIQVGQNGKPAMSASEGYVLSNIPYTAFFNPGRNELEVIIQVADFDYMAGGIIQSIYIGKQDDILRMSGRLNFFDGFVAACLLITGFYHLSIYSRRRKDIGVLYYGIYCILGSIFELFDGEKVFMQMFSEVPFDILMKIKYVSIFSSMVFLCLFINKIAARLIPRWLIRTAIIAVGGCGAVFGLTFPFNVYAKVEYIFILFGITIYIFIIVYLVRAIFYKQYETVERYVVIHLFIAFTCTVISFIDNILYLMSIKNNTFVGNAAILIFIATISDMLSRQYVTAYNTIEKMSDKLLELDRLKDEFLANTSHELRTPLNGIINITNSVLESRDGKLSQLQIQNLNVVVAAAQRLHNLINDILDMSSLEKGEIKLSQRPVDLHSIIESVIYVLKHLKGGKDIKFVNNVPESFPPVYADLERLRQIFYNLAGNALKFTAIGWIGIGARIKQNNAEIWVEDTGYGIPHDELQDVFKSFYQVNTGDAKEAGGTGLGLSITRKLIELHGGSITAASVEGKGTRFTFTLPFCKGNKSEVYVEDISKAFSEAVSTAPILVSPSEDKKDKYSILMADDDPASLTALFNILNNAGYYVKAVGSGKEVLNELEKHHQYDLVILDIMMPKISGYEVLKEIRKRFQPMDIPVLLVTAKARPEDLQIGFEAGANDYIPKPFEALELKARVKTLIKLKKSVSAALTTELSFLQAQIKPHFLHNSLSVITALSTCEPQRAKELLYDLSDYLRGSFDFENYNGVTPISGELSTVRAYISIEKERFRDKLKVEYDIDETIDISVPMLAIQPLVENAIRHGILKKPKGGTVNLSTKRSGEYVVITIRDDGVGIPPKKLHDLIHGEAGSSGVGIKNVQRRLILYYGQGLDIQSVEGQGTTVIMKIPDLTRGDYFDENNFGR